MAYSPTTEDIREIHPDYPTPIQAVNDLYIEHTIRVYAYFEAKRRSHNAETLNLIRALADDAPEQGSNT